MACSSNCTTGPHETFGACLRAKNLKSAVSIPGKDWDREVQSNWDKRINDYRHAREQGIQPTGSSRGQIDAAVRHSEKTGEAFRAS